MPSPAQRMFDVEQTELRKRTDGRVIGCDTSPSSSSALPCTTNHRRAAAMRCELPNLSYLYICTLSPGRPHVNLAGPHGENHRPLQLGTLGRCPVPDPASQLQRSCSTVQRRHRPSISPLKNKKINKKKERKKEREKEKEQEKKKIDDAPACFGRPNPVKGCTMHPSTVRAETSQAPSPSRHTAPPEHLPTSHRGSVQQQAAAFSVELLHCSCVVEGL